MAGRKGKDIYINVPLGVVVSNGEKDIGEILVHEQELLVAKGGKGGRGNVHFLTASDLAPRTAESGR